MASAREEESQKKGYIWLIMNMCDFKAPIEVHHGVGRVRSSVPHRLAAGHLCYNHPGLHPYVTGFHLFAGEEEKFRIRTHFGTRDQVDLALQLFGIPSDHLPIPRQDVPYSVADHLEWLEKTRNEEVMPHARAAEQLLRNGVVRPCRFDVLFGKSNLAREHTGTLRAWHLVQMHFVTYERLGKFQKTDVANKIISIIHESGGRFLKQTKNKRHWVEVTDVVARQKIAHWFRHARNKKCKEQVGSTTPEESPISTTGNKG